MQVQGEDKPYDDINITPMLDLAYVLLVIFIIMTTASVQGIKVNLPKASAAPSLAKPQTKAITIRDEPVTSSDLATFDCKIGSRYHQLIGLARIIGILPDRISQLFHRRCGLLK